MFKKFGTKKTVTFISSVTAILYLIYYIATEFIISDFSLDNLNYLGSYGAAFLAVFLAWFVLSLLTIILSIYYITKINSKEIVVLGQLVINLIIVIMLTLSLPGINNIVSLVSSASSGNFDLLFSIDDSFIAEISSSATVLGYMGYAAIVLIIYDIIVIMLTLSLPGINNIVSLVSSVSSGDLELLFSIDDSFIAEISSSATVLGYMGYAAIVLIIYDIIVWVLALTHIKIGGFSFDFVEEGIEESKVNKDIINNNNIDDFAMGFETTPNKATTSQNSSNNKQNSINFLQTSIGKAIIAIAVVIIVGVVGYNVYGAFFGYQTIHIFDENTTVEFTGYDGKGWISDISTPEFDYDESNEDINLFLDSISYDCEGDYSLSNGDTITITANYDEDEAKNLKLKIVDDTIEKEVNGLIFMYAKASEIPDTILNQALDDCDNMMALNYQGNSFTAYDYQYDSFYFAKNEDNSHNYLIALYKVTEKRTSFWDGSTTTSKYYVTASYYDVRSSFLNDTHMVNTHQLKDADGELVKDSTQIEGAIKNSYECPTVEQF